MISRAALLALALLVAGCSSAADDGVTVGSWPHHATGSDEVFSADVVPVCRKEALAIADKSSRQAAFDTCMKRNGF